MNASATVSESFSTSRAYPGIVLEDGSHRSSAKVHLIVGHSRTNTHPLRSMFYDVPEDSQPSKSAYQYGGCSSDIRYKIRPTFLDEGGLANKPMMHEEEDITSLDKDGIMDELVKINTGSTNRKVVTL